MAATDATTPRPQPDITLLRGWDDKGCYVWSPFVTKLELRLRLSGISYRTAAGSINTAPTGKIPYVEIHEKDAPPSTPPTKIGDSALIAKYLAEQGLIEDLDAGLRDATARAQDMALRALVEDRLYFFQMRERWIDNFHIHRDHILSTLPYPLRVLVGIIIYRRISQTLHGQGTGRYSAAEVRKFREELWTTLDGLLAESRKKTLERRRGSGGGGGGGGDDRSVCFWCLGGDGPTECDTSVFGFVNSTLVAKSSSGSKEFVSKLPAVVDYATRIHDTYFPDYEKW